MTRQTRSSAAKSPAVQSGDRGGRRRARRPNDTASESTEVASEQSEWSVRSIQAKKIAISGDIQYLVDWDNWSGDPTWEPEENCRDCLGAIRTFENKVARRRASLGRYSSDRSVSPTQPQQRRTSNRSSARNDRALERSSDRSESPTTRSQSKSFKRTPDKSTRNRRCS